jgi:hypothetical protein
MRNLLRLWFLECAAHIRRDWPEPHYPGTLGELYGRFAYNLTALAKELDRDRTRQPAI